MSGGFYVSWQAVATWVFVYLPALLGYYVLLWSVVVAIGRRKRGV
jgi:hypothetical protein